MFFQKRIYAYIFPQKEYTRIFSKKKNIRVYFSIKRIYAYIFPKNNIRVYFVIVGWSCVWEVSAVVMCVGGIGSGYVCGRYWQWSCVWEVLAAFCLISYICNFVFAFYFCSYFFLAFYCVSKNEDFWPSKNQDFHREMLVEFGIFELAGGGGGCGCGCGYVVCLVWIFGGKCSFDGSFLMGR